MRMKSNAAASLPRKFYPVGGTFVYAGARYAVMARPDTKLRDACVGCAFARINCPTKIACSSFDREDRVSVWFVCEDS